VNRSRKGKSRLYDLEADVRCWVRLVWLVIPSRTKGGIAGVARAYDVFARRQFVVLCEIDAAIRACVRWKQEWAKVECAFQRVVVSRGVSFALLV